MKILEEVRLCREELKTVNQRLDTLGAGERRPSEAVPKHTGE